MKAIFIIGPTAVGKTDLAFNISTKIKSALINADSVQVYKGLDIISGKDLPPDSKYINDHYLVKKTPVCLLDVADPAIPFSVFDFIKLAKGIVLKIISEERIPIVVGGTRFYIEALIKRIDTLSIPPDFALRAKLEVLHILDLQMRLGKINPNRLEKMNNSDRNNKRRLIRAIEVSNFKVIRLVNPIFSENEVLMIGLITSYPDLKKRISARLDKRIKEGAIAEAKKLFESYGKLSNQAKSTNGYKQLFEYFMGKIDLETAVREWKFSEYHLAKKQLSWLKNMENAHVFDIREEDYENAIFELIEKEFVLGRE